MHHKERKSAPITKQETGKYTYSAGGTPLNFNYEFSYSPESSESITYEAGPKGSPKNCLHEKVQRTHTFSPYSRVYKNGDSYTVSAIGIEAAAEALHGFDVSPDIPEGDDFLARAFNEMKPKFQAKFSLANFVLEMRELASLVPKAHGIVGRLKSTKALSEAHLNYSFGISPLISDIEALNESIKLYEMRYRQFLKNARKPHTSYYKEVLGSAKSEVRVPYKNHATSGEGLRVESRCISYTRTATMKYSYTIVGAPPPIGSLKLKAKYLGLRPGNAPSIIWNALPYSFVIDWVVNVGSWLKQFDESAIDVNVVVTSFMVSTKSHFRTTFEGFGGTGTNISSLSWNARLVVDRKSYARTKIPNMLGNPNVVEKLPVLDELSGRELVLGISLLNVSRK